MSINAISAGNSSATFTVTFPSELSSKEKNNYEQLKKLVPFSNFVLACTGIAIIAISVNSLWKLYNATMNCGPDQYIFDRSLYNSFSECMEKNPRFETDQINPCQIIRAPSNCPWRISNVVYKLFGASFPYLMLASFGAGLISHSREMASLITEKTQIEAARLPILESETIEKKTV